MADTMKNCTDERIFDKLQKVIKDATDHYLEGFEHIAIQTITLGNGGKYIYSLLPADTMVEIAYVPNYLTTLDSGRTLGLFNMEEFSIEQIVHMTRWLIRYYEGVEEG